MQLRRIVIISLALFCFALAACSQAATPTPEGQPISIPEMGKPGAGTGTVVPPAQTTKRAYPAPGTGTPTAPREERKTPYPPPVKGEALLNERCTKCHNLDRVKAAKKNADEWKAIVDRMIGKGVQLSPEETNALVQYLAETFK